MVARDPHGGRQVWGAEREGVGRHYVLCATRATRDNTVYGGRNTGRWPPFFLSRPAIRELYPSCCNGGSAGTTRVHIVLNFSSHRTRL